MLARFCIVVLAVAAAAGFAPAPTTAPVVSSVAVDAGVELRILRAGAETERAPVVFIPGWSFDADVWRAQMERFGRDRQVIAFDPRSQGRSSVVAWGNTPERRAEDLHAVIQSLGLSRPPVLVGWSQGVQDVAAYVERYGDEELAGVVLVDAAVSRGAAAIAAQPAEAAGQLRLLDIYLAHPRDYLRGMMAAIISRPQPSGFVDGLVETALRTPPSIGHSMLIADLYGADRTGSLARLTRPALVIASAQSPELEILRVQAAGLANGRLETVEDAGHAVFLDQPQRFGDLLQAFLDRLDRPSA
jgi:microsomal epoxide hydrolase